jgi:hypothetical protein
MATLISERWREREAIAIARLTTSTQIEQLRLAFFDGASTAACALSNCHAGTDAEIKQRLRVILDDLAEFNVKITG